MTNYPRIKCHKCQGTGKAFFTWEQRETFDAVTKLKRATANTLREKLDPNHQMHPTAFNNRLSDLFAAGVLERRRDGRHWVYCVKPTNKTKP